MTGPTFTIHADEHPEAVAVAHSIRFRKVSTRYPHMVALAYGRDIVAAAADPDDVVAQRVAAYEVEQGGEPRDWYAIGREERDPTRTTTRPADYAQ